MRSGRQLELDVEEELTSIDRTYVLVGLRNGDVLHYTTWALARVRIENPSKDATFLYSTRKEVSADWSRGGAADR